MICGMSIDLTVDVPNDFGLQSLFGDVEITAHPKVHASLTHVPDPPLPRAGLYSKEDEKPKPTLVGRVKNLTFKSRLLESKSPEAERLSKQLDVVWQKGLDLMKAHWGGDHNIEISIGRMQISDSNGQKRGMVDFVDVIKGKIQDKYPGANHIAIDFETMSIRFLRDGNEIKISEQDIPSEVKDILQFLSAWQSAHDIAMNIMGVQSWHTRVDFNGNRPVHGVEPFKIDNPIWAKFVPKSREQFIAAGHLEALSSKCPQGAADRIEKTDQFINNMKRELERAIEEEKAKTPADDALVHQLEKILKKFEEINLLATYWTVGHLDDLKGEEMSGKALNDKAVMITDTLSQHLLGQAAISKNKTAMPLDWYHVMRHGKPAEEDLGSFAIQTGDLMFHSDLDYLARFDANSGSRMVKSCIEEFIVDNMRHLESKTYVNDLRSLGMETLPPTTQARVSGIIDQARKAVS